MDPRLQLVLGFDLMRAAIEGNHNLRAAWDEAMDISIRSAQPLPHVYGGAIACLLFSVEALEEAGLLEDDQPPGPRDNFLHSGAAARQASIYAALDAKDATEIRALTSALVNAVIPNQKHLSFSGRLARVGKPKG